MAGVHTVTRIALQTSGPLTVIGIVASCRVKVVVSHVVQSPEATGPQEGARIYVGPPCQDSLCYVTPSADGSAVTSAIPKYRCNVDCP